MPVPARADRDRNHQRRARRAVRGPVHGRARPGGCGPSGSAPPWHIPRTQDAGHAQEGTGYMATDPPIPHGPADRRRPPAPGALQRNLNTTGGGSNLAADAIKAGAELHTSGPRQPGQAHGDHFRRSRTGYDTAAAPATAGMESAVITQSKPSGQTGSTAPYRIHRADAFKWLSEAEPNSIHAVVTNPPMRCDPIHS